MELAWVQRAGQLGGLTMAAITHVFTISRVAKMLGEDEDWLHEISIELDPEDGRLTVLGWAKREQRPSRASASITSLSSPKSIRPIPICSCAINRPSELAAALTGC